MYYFHSEVYKESYGIEPIPIITGLPPLLRFKSAFRGSKLATSIYFWENGNFETNPPLLNRYIGVCISVCKDLNGDYLLIKTGSKKIADKLSNIFSIDHNFVMNVLRISEDSDFVFQKVIGGKKRTEIRKGYRFKPTIKLGREDLINDFYDVFAITQTELGTPVHSKKYILSILRSDSTAKILVLYLDKKPVSGALTFIYGKALFHPLAGTINHFKKTGINSVLYWEMIKYGIKMKCTHFNMGRSIKGSGNAVFKRRWGGEERQLYFCYYLHRKNQIPRYGSAIMKKLTRIWSCFPITITKNFGQYFIKRIP